MSDRLEQVIVINTLRGLSNLVGKSPTLITSRQSLFQSKEDETEALRMELANIDNTEFFQIEKLNDDQIFKYICAKLKSDEAETMWGILSSNSNLFELAQKPLFLGMLVKSFTLNKLSDLTSMSTLYETYLDSWLNREIEKGRTLITREKKRDIMHKLAWVWLENGEINWKDIYDVVHEEFYEEVNVKKQIDSYIADIQVSSFIGRSGEGLYFQHNSFAEYFVSQSISIDESKGTIYSKYRRLPLQNRIIISAFIDDLDTVIEIFKIEKSTGIKLNLINKITKKEDLLNLAVNEEESQISAELLSKLQGFPREEYNEILEQELEKYPPKSAEYLFLNKLVDFDENGALEVILDDKTADTIKHHALKKISSNEYLRQIIIETRSPRLRLAAADRLPIDSLLKFLDEPKSAQEIQIFAIQFCDDWIKLIQLAQGGKSKTIKESAIRRLIKLKDETPQDFLMKLSYDDKLTILAVNKGTAYTSAIFDLCDEEELMNMYHRGKTTSSMKRAIIQKIVNVQILKNIKGQKRLQKAINLRIKQLVQEKQN
ncbi:MAG: hypothetical protein GPJ54_09420 [Candidatus Heimdallarchaeota archaeon]|nr:hypothetical protein [Candidatus Heimdallarchaeota archaeon]